MEAAAATRQDLLDSSNLVVLGTGAGIRTGAAALTAEASEAEALGRLARAARAFGQMALFQIALGQLSDAVGH